MKEDKEGWLSGQKHRVRKATEKRNIGGSNPSPSTNTTRGAYLGTTNGRGV